MNLQMDVSLARDYKSPSQVAKILTENWIAQESYCPSCLSSLTQAKANARVLDFICKSCDFDFELKSKKGFFGKKITDGAYDSMIERLGQPSSPHFFFMGYSPDFKVQDLIVDRKKVKQKWSQTSFLNEVESIDSRGWTLDVLSCVERLKTASFTLGQVYQFEPELSDKHPNNKHIKDKIRQQLQILRDRGLIEFLSPGLYSYRRYL